MNLIRLKSVHPETSYAPSWDIPLFQSVWDDVDKYNKIVTWLAKNEQMFLDTLPAYSSGNDGNTGLGQESVTSRFGLYNLFNYADQLPELNQLLTFFRISYLNFVQSDQTDIKELDIICWFNILRKDQDIKEHYHGAGSDVYLSGNYHLDNYDTKTYYITPYDKSTTHEFDNKQGGLTMFPSWLTHGTTQCSEDMRISVAFDLRLSNNATNSTFHSIPFINEEIYKVLVDNNRK
jgi:hypothetical protein